MKLILAIAMVVTGTPLFAAPGQDGTSSASNPIVVNGSTPTPPRQICRRIPAMSGSHVSRVRVCRTAAQWRAMSDFAVDDAIDRLDALTVAQRGPRDGYTSSGAHGPR